MYIKFYMCVVCVFLCAVTVCILHVCYLTLVLFSIVLLLLSNDTQLSLWTFCLGV